MSDAVEKVKDQRGLLEKVVSYIPGYHGYKEKEIRRETDRLVRQQASGSLKRASDSLKRSLSSNVEPPEGKRIAVDRVLARLDLLKGRIAKAVGGYSGFFDAVKVREGRLDQMISVDYEVVNLSSALSEKVQRVAQAGVLAPTWSQGLAEVELDIGRVEDALQRRETLLSQP